MVVEQLQDLRSLHLPSGFGVLPFGRSWSRSMMSAMACSDCPHCDPGARRRRPFVVRTQDIITGVFRAASCRVSEET